MKGKRRGAAVILPDYAARVTVLDFDRCLPSKTNSFRWCASASEKPFRLTSMPPRSAITSSRIPEKAKSKWWPLRGTRNRVRATKRCFAMPGSIRHRDTSSLAALNLYRGRWRHGGGQARGNVLTVMALSGNVLKLLRCVALDQADEEEILGVLQPTFAYVEDELGAPAKRVLLCGFPHQPATSALRKPSRCAAYPLRRNTWCVQRGLLGYMEGAGGTSPSIFPRAVSQDRPLVRRLGDLLDFTDRAAGRDGFPDRERRHRNEGHPLRCRAVERTRPPVDHRAARIDTRCASR